MPVGQEWDSPVLSAQRKLQSFYRCVNSLHHMLNNSFQSTSLSQLVCLLNLKKEQGSLSPSSPYRFRIRNKDMKSVPEEMTQEGYLRLQFLDDMEKWDDIGHFLSLFSIELLYALGHDHI